MAHYLVSAVPRPDRLAQLEAHLANEDFVGLRPFGVAAPAAVSGVSGQLR